MTNFQIDPLFIVYGSVENGQKSEMIFSSMVISHRNMNVEVRDQTMGWQ